MILILRMNYLYVLNNNKYLFSTYAKDKSFIFTSYDNAKICKVQKIINEHHQNTRTWIKSIENVYLYSDDHIQIDLTSTSYCNLDEPVEKMDVTFFDTHNQADMLFLYQLNELMNTNIYVINDFEYNDKSENVPILTLQGFFVEYKPKHIELEINRYEYLDALYGIDTEY